MPSWYKLDYHIDKKQQAQSYNPPFQSVSGCHIMGEFLTMKNIFAISLFTYHQCLSMFVRFWLHLKQAQFTEHVWHFSISMLLCNLLLSIMISLVKTLQVQKQLNTSKVILTIKSYMASPQTFFFLTMWESKVKMHEDMLTSFSYDTQFRSKFLWNINNSLLLWAD